MSNHDDSVFVRNFSLVLVGLIIIGLIAFVLAKIVDHHFRQTQDHSAAMTPRIAPVGEVNIGGEPVALAGTAPAPTAAAAPAEASGDPGKATYDSICFSCHAQGIAGAPKFADKAAWEPRLAEGHDVLVEHAIKGFTGKTGMMPAKGGNPSLSDADVTAAVDFMLAAVGEGGAAASATESAAPAAATQETAAPAPATPETAVPAPNPEAAATDAAAPADAATAVADTGKGKEIYDKACNICHATGVGGAPKLGDTAAWAPRIAKGMDALYHSSLNGLMTSTGMMPPKGGRPDFSDDEVKAAVDYMVSNAK